MKIIVTLLILITASFCANAQPMSIRDPQLLKNFNRVTSSPSVASNALIPTMTGNNTPSGLASASGIVGGQQVYWAFDGINGSLWGSPSVITSWLQYQFATGHVVISYKIVSPTSGSFFNTWVLAGSNDGSSWATLHSTSTGVSGTVYSFANTTSYSYYRVTFTAPFAGNMYIDAIQLYGQ
jgi:hypothetical protein